MLDDPDRDPIEILADRFLQQHRDGERPTISQFAQQFPEHADDILELFPMLVDLERLKETEVKSHPRPATVGAIPQRTLGDFEILSEIGRGGMGIVYLARQKSLGRHVALKVLSKSLADSPQQVERFHQEAEAAAGLHHTNIVPVYGVGQQDDFHYYAMQWIDGIGLDQVIAQLAEDPQRAPVNQREEMSTVRKRFSDSGSLQHGSYFRNVARIAADIADALAYAHQHNVLHRDVKPSNILLDKSGDPWITDFGLAKLADDRGLTQTGELIGTLRYMAPEQFEGNVDQRSDVYSLGLTLYELLTLKPAFPESQQARLLTQRTRGQVPTPRSHNPHLPRDLETIVLTACATEPAHRYPSAEPLHDDLVRFLEGRPIQARRISSTERFWRWCRRNPAIAGTSALASALLLTVAVVSVTAYLRTSAALQQTQQANRAVVTAKHQADQARFRAEENLRVAIDAFDSIFDNVTRRGVPQSMSFEYGDVDQSTMTSMLTTDDAALLTQLLHFYQQFSDQNGDDRLLKKRILSARMRMGEIQVRLGDFDAAELSFQAAQQLTDEILETEPQDRSTLRSRMQLLNDRGDLAYQRRRPEGEPGFPPPGFRLHQQTLSEIDQLPPALQADSWIQYQRARAFDLMGSTMFRSQLYAGIVANRPMEQNGRPRGPRRRPEGSGQPTAGGPPQNRSPWDALGNLARRMGAGPGKGPLPDIEEAIQILEQLVDAEPQQRDFASLLAKALQHRYVFLIMHHQPEAATEAFLAAEDRIRQSVKQQPDNPQLLLDLADHLSTASAQETHLDLTTVETKIHESIQLSQDLCQRFPNVPEYQALLASAHRSLAAVLSQQGDVYQTLHHLDVARETLQALRTPARSKYHQWSLAITLIEASQALLDQEEPATRSKRERLAIDYLEQAVAVCQQAEPQPTGTGQHLLAMAYQHLVPLYHATGQPEKARLAHDQAHWSVPRRFPFRGLFRRGPAGDRPSAETDSSNRPVERPEIPSDASQSSDDDD